MFPMTQDAGSTRSLFRTLSAGGVLGMTLWLLWRDPYSHGYGISDSPFYDGDLRFQSAIAIVEAVLLVLAVTCVRAAPKLSKHLLRTELVIFVVANGIYLVRDGHLRLAFGGYSHVPTGSAAILGGVAFRWWLFRRFRQ